MVGTENRSPKLFDRIREVIRLKHYSLSTEKTYVSWVKRYLLFHNMRHPREMGRQEVESFLSYLATTCRVASSTQNQGFNAILFLYNEVLKLKLDGEIDAIRAICPMRIPVVMSPPDLGL